ncbi:MAG: Gfo/Idh/MocA family oxidoreductase [Chitinophagaceae bacterium]
MQRRQFINNTSMLAAGISLLPRDIVRKPKEEKKARIAFIGTGMRGSYLLKEAVSQGMTDVIAVCDIDEAAINNVKQTIKEYNAKEPDYYKGERDFEKIVQRDDVDAVIIATAWQWHYPMTMASLKAGKYTGCEVICGITINEIWDLVNEYERSRAPYMMLENVCYRRDVMAVLNMVRKGLFGDINYAECGYQHDLREYLFNDGQHMFGHGVEFNEKAINEAHWRTQHYTYRNGDLYPTHGIGPVSTMLNITRGNQFTQLVSMASPGRGLHKYIVDNGPADHPNAKVKFKCGDVVTTLIQCANGEMIKMTFDTSSPRPYSLGFRVQGTEGLWTEDAKGIYLQKFAKQPHEYDPVDKYIEQYDHPYWAKHAHDAENSGHGGMDYFIIREFVNCVRNKQALPMDMYDAAMWTALTPLSEKSLSQNSKTVHIPDFTRGKWKKRTPVFGLSGFDIG